MVFSLLTNDLISLDMLVLEGLPESVFNPNFKKFTATNKVVPGGALKRRYAPNEGFRASQIVEYG